VPPLLNGYGLIETGRNNGAGIPSILIILPGSDDHLSLQPPAASSLYSTYGAGAYSDPAGCIIKRIFCIDGIRRPAFGTRRTGFGAHSKSPKSIKVITTGVALEADQWHRPSFRLKVDY